MPIDITNAILQLESRTAYSRRVPPPSHRTLVIARRLCDMARGAVNTGGWERLDYTKLWRSHPESLKRWKRDAAVTDAFICHERQAHGPPLAVAQVKGDAPPQRPAGWFVAIDDWPLRDQGRVLWFKTAEAAQKAATAAALRTRLRLAFEIAVDRFREMDAGLRWHDTDTHWRLFEALNDLHGAFALAGEHWRGDSLDLTIDPGSVSELEFWAARTTVLLLRRFDDISTDDWRPGGPEDQRWDGIMAKAAEIARSLRSPAVLH